MAPGRAQGYGSDPGRSEMPIYEYRCDTCGNEYEELTRRGTRDEEVECPECGTHESDRVLSAFAVSGGSSGGGVSAGSSGGGGCGSSGFG